MRYQFEEAQSALLLLLSVGLLGTFMRALPLVRAFREASRFEVRASGSVPVPGPAGAGAGAGAGEATVGPGSVASMLAVTGRSRRKFQELWGRFSRRIFRLSLMIREVGIHF